MNKIILAFNSIFGQTKEEKYAKDVKSVDAIIYAFYDVISGSSGGLGNLKELNIFIQKPLL